MKAAGVDAGSAYVYALRMTRKGLLFPIENGKYTLSGDPYIVASQISSVSYISFISALSLYGQVEQVLKDIFVVSPVFHREIDFGGMTIRFIKFPKDLFFGYRKIQREGSYIMLADKEKALTDSLYRTKYVRFNVLLKAMENETDYTKFVEYVIRYGRESVIRRAGFLLDFIGVKHNLKPGTRVFYKLNPALEESGVLNRKWKLYVNDDFEGGTE
ncbi:transcriptional regulator [mine drainage metagenome]|uniref:Transcriptional regulator n=1 Tax=mine drainage metagenome TaxID=410659 RepID=T0YI09_9ZZZZ